MLRRFLIVNILLIALTVPARSARADTDPGSPRWFPETGHTLAYSFRVFWEKHGGLPILGYPLTEVFVEDGRPVQYFERSRLEWHADQGLVLAGHLGRWAADGNAEHPAFAVAESRANEGRDYFVETGHNLGGSFQQFWHLNGGLPVFGFPLSEEFPEVNPTDGQTYLVQYFERGRFEWHPDLPPQWQVLLGQLGRQYLEAERPAPDWTLQPVGGPEHAWDGLRPTRIRVPRIALDTEIVEAGFSLGGWDVPRYTAAHYWPVAAFPGTRGNISIAGHIGYKDTIFNHLPEAVVGDEIILSIGQRERRYRVTDIWTVEPADTWVMRPTSTEMLTLITCVPIREYTHRLIVRAVPIEE